MSNNREIGVEVKRGPFDGSATYFRSSSDKGQLLVPGTGRNFDVQRQRIEIEGLELNPRTDAGMAQPDQRNNFGGYAVTDASIRYQAGFSGLRLSVQNLFDKFHIDYSSDTRLPTDNLAYFAGRGRSFKLSWDYSF